MEQDGVMSVVNELSVDESLHKKESEDVEVDPDFHQVRILAHKT